MSGSTLLAMAPAGLARQIRQATRRVIYAAPGLTDEIAVALIQAATHLGPDAIRVVIDPSPETCRLGYGQIEAVEHLAEAGIEMGRAPGLRIGCLCVDDEGWLFSPTPLLIEAGPRDRDAPNGIRVEPAQTERLADAIAPRPLPLVPKPPPEIGAAAIEPKEIADAKKSLETNPPRQFDIARVQHVFNSAIEFVEIELRGLQIQRKVVRLPPDLVMSVSNEEARARLDAAYRLIDRKRVLAGDLIRRKLDELRKLYLTDTKGFGKVILRAKRPEFEQKIQELKGRIEEHQQEVLLNLQREIDLSRAKLIEWLLPGLLSNPPARLNARVVGPIDEQGAQNYLERELQRLLPKAADVVGAMKLECRFKAVTYETLQNEEFKKDVAKGYPELQRLMDEFEAARANAGLAPTRPERA